MKITFAEPSASKSRVPKSGALVVGVAPKQKLSATAAQLDTATAGAVTRAISASRFSGKEGQSLEILAPSGISNDWLILVGVGGGLGDVSYIPLMLSVIRRVEISWIPVTLNTKLPR